MIQANVVNQQTLRWVHNKMGTLKPYRPEARHTQDPSGLESSDDHPEDQEFEELEEQLKNLGSARWSGLESSWRATELPLWSMEDSIVFRAGDLDDMPPPMLFGVPIDFKPPAGKHRWLPYDARTYGDPSSATADGFDFRQRPSISIPLTQDTFDFNGPGKWPWTVFAQQLYSFLEHVEEESAAHPTEASSTSKEDRQSHPVEGLARYHFPLWAYGNEPTSLSLFLISSSDIHAATPRPAPFPYYADEAELGRWLVNPAVISKMQGRGAVIDGHAVAVRFAPAPASKRTPWMDGDIGSALEKTDLLDRFKAYGDEIGCRAKHQTTVWKG